MTYYGFSVWVALVIIEDSAVPLLLHTNHKGVGQGLGQTVAINLLLQSALIANNLSSCKANCSDIPLDVKLSVFRMLYGGHVRPSEECMLLHVVCGMYGVESQGRDVMWLSKPKMIRRTLAQEE